MISRLLYFLGAIFVKVYTKLMLKVDILYHAPMPKGVKIIVANHPTTSDPFIITSLTKGQAGILIKDIMFDVPIFGRYLKWAGHISVIPSQGREAFEKALKLLREGKSVVVFIEGEISGSEGKYSKPRTGSIRLALSLNIPIIPVGIGIKKENIVKLKSVVRGRKDVGSWYFFGPYAITVGKPIIIKGNIEDRSFVRSQSEMVMKKVNKLTDESLQRIV